MKKVILITLAVIFVICAGATAFVYYEYNKFAKTPAQKNGPQKTIVIASGQGFSKTVKMLSKAKLISNPFMFKILARHRGYDKQVKAGEYVLSGSMNPIEILQALKKGRDKLFRLTIPEGLTINQIAVAVEESGFGWASDFKAAAFDAEFAKKLGIPGKNFEGYLFPETYYFPKNTDYRDIITAMVKRFNVVFTKEMQYRADDINLTKHEVVTLASIVEKETGAAFERPIISSVFHNRLKKGMRLETDPTVIYGIKDFDGNLKRKHLMEYTPYNTYKIKGLPPGPIANPGVDSIMAALYPDDTPFLFFVSKKDTTHKFSTNIRDHNRAVQKYQLRRRRRN